MWLTAECFRVQISINPEAFMLSELSGRCSGRHQAVEQTGTCLWTISAQEQKQQIHSTTASKDSTYKSAGLTACGHDVTGMICLASKMPEA